MSENGEVNVVDSSTVLPSSAALIHNHISTHTNHDRVLTDSLEEGDDGADAQRSRQGSFDSPEHADQRPKSNKSTFKITSVTIHSAEKSSSQDGLMAVNDDEDESVLDESSTQNEVNGTPSAPTVDVKRQDRIDSTSRFKVVKIQKREPYSIGRWKISDFTSEADVNSSKIVDITTSKKGSESGNSSRASSNHYVHGVDDPAKNPLASITSSINHTLPTIQQSNSAQSVTTTNASKPNAADNGPNNNKVQSIPTDQQAPTSASAVSAAPTKDFTDQKTDCAVADINLVDTVTTTTTTPSSNVVTATGAVLASATGTATGGDVSLPSGSSHPASVSTAAATHVDSNALVNSYHSSQGDNPLDVNHTVGLADLEDVHIAAIPPDPVTSLSSAESTSESSSTLEAIQGQTTAISNPPVTLPFAADGSSTPKASEKKPDSLLSTDSPAKSDDVPETPETAAELDAALETIVVDNATSVDGEKADDADATASGVAIDNKIEQAMDLVKSHLMLAVREEVEELKLQIKQLVERNGQLEQENQLLRSTAATDTLQQLSALNRQQSQNSNR